MEFHVLTLFPELFHQFLATSIVGRAHGTDQVITRLWNIRDYTADKHRTVDDTPYGGGPGMIMKIEPIHATLQAIHKLYGTNEHHLQKTVVLSARGNIYIQKKAREYASLKRLVLICGRYEGIDQRVADHLADEEIAIGQYVLTGGEIAAMAVMESVIRLIPDVLGNPDSLIEESFAKLPTPRSPALPAGQFTHSGEYPQYTKPENYKGWGVPDILLSGNHEAIARWRLSNIHR